MPSGDALALFEGEEPRAAFEGGLLLPAALGRPGLLPRPGLPPAFVGGEEGVLPFKGEEGSVVSAAAAASP